MKFLEKLTSKKGQIAMELGILVMAAVAVAAIAAYFYATNVKDSQTNVAESATNTTGALSTVASNATDGIEAITV